MPLGVIIVVIISESLYHVLANLLSPPQNLYLYTYGCAADPCEHKPVGAECSGNNGAVNSNLEVFADEAREVKETIFGCLVDRLYREDVAYYADGYESVCYGAVGGWRVRGGVLGEVWSLRERRETLGEIGSRESSPAEDGAVDRGRFFGVKGEEIGSGGNGSAA